METELLITTFAPFRGRDQNGSHTIGKAIQALAGTQLEVLHLPVHWGSIERLALPRIELLKPRIVLGLGEGKPDAVNFECMAFNERLGEDERGASPPSEIIDPSGPERISVRWPCQPQSISEENPAVQVSNDAGRFLCNNALYRFLQCPIPFAAFLHLPPQGSQSDTDYLNDYLPTVQKTIKSAQVIR